MEQIRASMNEVAEGVATTPAAARLAEQLGLDLPIVQAVNAIIAGKITARYEIPPGSVIPI